jgi:hypothetical protein
MFKKIKDYGQAYVAATKTALDPERIRQEISAMDNLKYAMPNAWAETQPAMTGLAPGPVVTPGEAAQQRAAAVAAYLPPASGPEQPPVRVDRFFMEGPSAAQAYAKVIRQGLEARRTYGIYPSTDLIYPARFGQAPVPWEWCVVHRDPVEANDPSYRPTPPGDVTIDVVLRGQRWIDRPKSLPFPYDEEVVALLASRVGIDPATCMGISRLLEWGAYPSAPERMVGVQPVGAQLVTVGRRPPLASVAPVPFGEGQSLPAHVRVELLRWTPISLAIQPVWTQPPQPMTAYPQLPQSPEELLTTYLAIVGVMPEDTYGVSVSVVEQQSGFLNAGSVHADRGQTASMIALVYRDTPTYAEGRGRFERYRREQLKVPLDVPRGAVGRLERYAIDGIKWHVKRQIGSDNYDAIGGDEGWDADTYPYIAGPTPR